MPCIRLRPPALCRDAEPEPRHSSLGFGADVAAGRLDDLLHDRQADARSTVLAVARLVHAVEPLEDVGQVLCRDPVAAVADADEDVCVAPFGADADPAA